MLFYPIVLLVWAVTCLATPPPGYVKKPDDDKDPPAYQYKYDIADAKAGTGYGKAETRSGEFASGRYYVNENQANTDVKYFADHWGYHPLVEYGSTGPHSTSTTRFALGEMAVAALRNGGDVGHKVELPARSQKRRPIQIIQPYTVQKASVTPDFATDINPTSTSSPEGNNGISPDMKDTTVGQDEHYVNRPQEPSSILIASNGIPSEGGSTPGYAETPQTFVYTASTESPSVQFVPVQGIQSTSGNDGNQNGASPDEQLFLQTIGNFGQKVQPFSSGNTDFNERQYSTTTIRPSISDEAYSSTKQNGDITYTVHTSLDANTAYLSSAKNKKQQGLNQYLYSQQLFTPATSGSFNSSENNLGGIVYASTTLAPIDSSNQVLQTSTPAGDLPSNSLFSGEQTAYEYSNSIGGDKQTYIGLSAYGSTGVAETGYTKLGTANPQLINYGFRVEHSLDGKQELETTGLSAYSTASSYSSTSSEDYSKLQTISDTAPPAAPGIFSKPIVVADLTNYNQPEYSTTYKCDDDNEVSSTPNPAYSTTLQPIISTGTVLVTPKPQGHGHITTSSVILNPIQAGVSLVNAEETDLISNGADKPPPPVKEVSSEDSQDAPTYNNQQAVSIRKDIAETTYEKINPAFGQEQQQIQLKSNSVSVSSDRDQEIEIQKSVEIYHNAPVQEIHYPVQLAVSQVSQIDQPQGQPQYIEPQNDENTQQAHQENGGSTAQISFEINHNSNAAYQTNQAANIEQTYQVHQNAHTQQTYEIAQAINAEQAYDIAQINAQQLHSSAQTEEAHGQQLYSTDEQRKNAQHVFAVIQQSNHEDARGSSQQNLQNVNHASGQQTLTQDSDTQHSYQVNHDTSVQQNYDINLQNNAQRLYLVQQQAAGQNGYNADLAAANLNSYHGNQNANSHTYELNQGQQNVAVALPYTLEASKEVAIPQIQTEAEVVENPVDRPIDKQVHVPVLQSYPVELEKIVEKKVHVPQPYPVEVVKSIPYPVEKIIEKQVLVSEPYPVHIHVPVGRILEKKVPYSVETIVEKKVPVPQPYPVEKLVEKIVHIPQPYPVEVTKIVEKPVDRIIEKKVEVRIPQPYPVHVPQPYPVEVEKIVEKKVHVPQPYPVHIPVDRIVEKIVKVPQPYPVEKIVEKKVPYPVERIVEKKVPVPQPYPVHVQVPVDRIVEKQVSVPQPYPVHIKVPQPYLVEKLVEKKVPYPVEKIVEKKIHVPQPYPVQVEKIVEKKVPYPVEVTKYIERPVHVPHPYPVEKIVEKSVPYPVEKIVEKQVHVPQPYPVEKIVEKIVERPVHIRVPYPVEVIKNVPYPVTIPYGVQYGVSYQHIMQPQAHNLYASYQTTQTPLYGLPLTNNHQGAHFKENTNSESKQQFQGYVYNKPAISFVEGGNANNNQNSAFDQPMHFKQLLPKKLGYFNFSAQKPSSSTHSSFNHYMQRRHNARSSNKESSKSDEYIGPVPPQQTSNVHHQHSVLTKSQQYSTTATRPPTTSTTSRRTKQPDNQSQSKTGSFRQSRMEYGFRPPMVPSVQYDEKTQSKVES